MEQSQSPQPRSLLGRLDLALQRPPPTKETLRPVQCQLEAQDAKLAASKSKLPPSLFEAFIRPSLRQERVQRAEDEEANKHSADPAAGSQQDMLPLHTREHLGGSAGSLQLPSALICYCASVCCSLDSVR